LLSYSARVAGGETTYPLGADPIGSLVYTAGGWMSGMLAARDRPNLSTTDMMGGTETERASAFSSYIAYCGEYEIEGDVVIHRVAMSMFPNWVGGDQRRFFELSGDELLLRTPPMEINGEMVVNELRWVRAE
jgi:hypothetical protein